MELEKDNPRTDRDKSKQEWHGQTPTGKKETAEQRIGTYSPDTEAGFCVNTVCVNCLYSPQTGSTN